MTTFVLSDTGKKNKSKLKAVKMILYLPPLSMEKSIEHF